MNWANADIEMVIDASRLVRKQYYAWQVTNFCHACCMEKLAAHR